MGRQEDIYNFISKPIERYNSVLGCEITTDISVLDECFYKVEESLAKYFESSETYDPSSYKISGVVCFWLRKLKPFSVDEEPEQHRFVNEMIAFLTGYYLTYWFQTSMGGAHKPKISDTYFNDIVASFRYNSHSPNSSAFIFESLCL